MSAPATFHDTARSTPCPRHGEACRLAGTRGRWWTWLCGSTFHSDSEVVKRLLLTNFRPSAIEDDE